MVFLWTALRTILWEIAGKFTLFLTKRLPVVVASTAMILTIVVAYLFAMHSLSSAIGQTIPGIVYNVWSWVMPGNAIPCLFAVLSARIVRWTYTRYEKMVNFRIRSLMP